MGSAVGEHDPLMDAGLDSLGAVEVKASIERSTGVQLPATVVFDYPSVGAIAAYLSSIAGPSPGEADDASLGL
jgi:acyl carrier protein